MLFSAEPSLPTVLFCSYLIMMSWIQATYKQHSCNPNQAVVPNDLEQRWNAHFRQMRYLASHLCTLRPASEERGARFSWLAHELCRLPISGWDREATYFLQYLGECFPTSCSSGMAFQLV